MTSKDIKILVEKYWAGETTRIEEATLKTWYTEHADGSDPETERYFSMLGNFAKIKSDSNRTFELPENTSARRPNKSRKIDFAYWSRIAAVLLVALGIGLIWKMQPQKVELAATEEIYTEEEIQQSYEEAKSALLLIAAKLNKGKETVGQLEKFAETKQRISK